MSCPTFPALKVYVLSGTAVNGAPYWAISEPHAVSSPCHKELLSQDCLNRPKLLICDEPTSALDPVGRKEILDILLAIREQTTVLFSTHILSDVERICTDVAFLNSGVVGVQGKLSDIKTRYRSEEYQLETGNDTDMLILQQTFPNMQQIGRNQLVFCEGDYTVFDILRFIADRHIALLKLERADPTLESLFMEVVKK